MIRAALIASTLVLFAAQASAWWAPEWTARKTIGINTTAAGMNLQQPAADVPVLLRLHGGNFPQFLNAKEGGADFRFVAADDKTPLKYHVEKFDAASQIALIWVKVPTLKPQSVDNKIYLYFANQAATKGDDAAATYDVDTAAVFHFAESAPPPLDSTAYKTATIGAVIPNPASLLGNGAILSGAEVLTVQDAPHIRLMPDKGWAASLWVKFDTLPTETGYILSRSDAAEHLSIELRAGGIIAAKLGTEELLAAAPIAAAQWVHVAIAIVSGQLQLFVNGVQAGSAPVTVTEMGGALLIGGDTGSKGGLAMQVDELKIYSNARNSEYFAAQFALEGEHSDTVMSYGADETSDTAAEAGEPKTQSHFGIIIQNVFGRKEAIVEQSVIGVCVVMAAIAIMVMFLKAVYLSRCRGATDRFLKAYRAQVSTATSNLDVLLPREKTFTDSPLFRIYKQGLEEVRGRLSPSVGAAAAGLGEKALNTIRATLDATSVRENQRLNSLLVLLTIAISGGPFIGLLGTVVGVMVTFAAIAATGDINIAAIAPGMAAALLATVAGLGVAIPSLFGYNYLSAKAKDVTADMRVFADEFVAKLNEVHGL